MRNASLSIETMWFFSGLVQFGADQFGKQIFFPNIPLGSGRPQNPKTPEFIWLLIEVLETPQFSIYYVQLFVYHVQHSAPPTPCCQTIHQWNSLDRQGISGVYGLLLTRKIAFWIQPVCRTYLRFEVYVGNSI